MEDVIDKVHCLQWVIGNYSIPSATPEEPAERHERLGFGVTFILCIMGLRQAVLCVMGWKM